MLVLVSLYLLGYFMLIEREAFRHFQNYFPRVVCLLLSKIFQRLHTNKQTIQNNVHHKSINLRLGWSFE